MWRRKPEGERGALVGCALQRDVAAHQSRQSPADREAQTRTTVLPRVYPVLNPVRVQRLHEWLEDLFLVLGGDSHSRVGNAHIRPAFAARESRRRIPS